MAKKKKQQVRDSEYTRERDSVYGSSRFQGKFQSLYSGDSEDPYFGEGFRTGGRKKTKKAKATTRPADRYADRYADRSADRFSDRYGDSYAERNADLFDGRSSDRYAERSADRYEGRKAERTNNRKKTSVSRVSEEKKRSIAASFGFVSEEEYYPEGKDAGKRSGSAAGDIAGTLAGGIFSWTKEFIQFAGGDKQKRRITLPQRNEQNFTLVACVIALLVIGLIMVTSSSYYDAYNTMDDPMYYFRRQFIWSLIGIVAMVLVSKVPMTTVRNLALPGYIAALVCSTLVFFIGVEVNGSTRWLGFGSLSFQPAELAKLAVAVYISKLADDFHDRMGEFGTFAMMLILVLIPTGLVAYQNLSSGIIVAAIGVIIMFVGGAKVKHFLMVVGPLAGIVVLLLVLPLLINTDNMTGPLGDFLREFSYRTARITAWMDPFEDAMGDGYQTVQALYAVGSGGFFGRGLGQSLQKLGYIPFAYNDIIFAVICEELGMFGAIIVAVLFTAFAWNGIKISLNAPNRYCSYVAVSLVGQISLQALLHIAVNTNSIPATGIGLPFISYGGSSMAFLMTSVGVILNISTYSAEQKEPAQVPGKEAT